MIEHVVREWWNNKIEQWCYNNHELGCCIISGFACSNIRKQPDLPSCNNMLKHDWTKLLFYQSCSIMLKVLLQGCWANNLVIACDIFIHVHQSWIQTEIDLVTSCLFRYRKWNLGDDIEVVVRCEHDAVLHPGGTHINVKALNEWESKVQRKKKKKLKGRLL